MLWTFSFLLMVLWLMGLVTGYTLGGVAHSLPVFAVVAAILGGLKRRRRYVEPHGSGPAARGFH